MSVAFLFPGQGSQHPNMLHELPEHPIVAKVIEEASTVLGRDVLTLDTEESLLSTVSVQLSLLISGVAVARVLMSEGAYPYIVAGHSVGSFTAAVVSSALDFPDALSVVELRGRLMEDSYPKGYGMGVIVGLDELQVNRLLGMVNAPNMPVYIANLNAQDQVTIAGSLSAIKEVFKLALSAGAHKVKILKVSVPSHCELLKGITCEIINKMNSILMKPPKVLFIGNCRARVLHNAEEIKNDLSMGLTNPVKWYEATTSMFERGVRLFVELGPGEVLTNMAKKAFPDARCISALSSGIESTCILIKRETDFKY